MSVDNTYDELVSTQSPIETDKPSSQPATDNSSSLNYTPRTTSTSAFSPSTALPDASTYSTKIHNRI